MNTSCRVWRQPCEATDTNLFPPLSNSPQASITWMHRIWWTQSFHLNTTATAKKFLMPWTEKMSRMKWMTWLRSSHSQVPHKIQIFLFATRNRDWEKSWRKQSTTSTPSTKRSNRTWNDRWQSPRRHISSSALLPSKLQIRRRTICRLTCIWCPIHSSSSKNWNTKCKWISPYLKTRKQWMKQLVSSATPWPCRWLSRNSTSK